MNATQGVKARTFRGGGAGTLAVDVRVVGVRVGCLSFIIPPSLHVEKSGQCACNSIGNLKTQGEKKKHRTSPISHPFPRTKQICKPPPPPPCWWSRKSKWNRTRNKKASKILLERFSCRTCMRPRTGEGSHGADGRCGVPVAGGVVSGQVRATKERRERERRRHVVS